MEQNILIGKVSLNSSILFGMREKPSDVKMLVYNQIKEHNDNIYRLKQLYYAIEIIEEFTLNNKSFIFGKMSGYKPKDKVEEFDEDEMKSKRIIRDNTVRKKIYFMYERDSQYLFFENISDLKEETYIKMFKYIINKDNIRLDIDINVILDKEKTKMEIKKFKKIIKACFEVIPDNPGNKLDDKIDDLVSNFGAVQAKMEFENEEGLNKGEEIEQLVNDINEGRKKRYAFTGYDHEGNYKKMDSDDDDNKVVICKEVDKSEEGRKGGLWEAIQETLNL